MTVRDWLDADIGLILQRGRGFLDWWFSELAEMARPLLRGRAADPDKLIAERGRDGVYRLSRDGAPAGEHVAGDGRLRAALAAPSDAALVQRLSRPPLSDRDLTRMTVLDIDRLTPFTPDEVYYDVAVSPASGPAEPREVRLAVIPRTVADACLELARLEGVEPSALLAIQPGARVDFMPAVRSGQVRAAASPASAVAWGLVAALTAANVAVAVWRDTRATDALQAMADAQAPVAARVQLARQQIARLQADATGQAAAHARGEPIRILNAASAVLPDGAWVQRLAWDGQDVRLTGQAKSGVDSLAALRRDPIFADARAFDVVDPASGPSFDITARVPAPPALRRP